MALKEMPKVGDKLRMINKGIYVGLDDKYIGKEFTITGIDEDGDAYSDDLVGAKWYVMNNEFDLYELVSDGNNEDASEDASVIRVTTESLAELIASLALEVVKLRREVASIKDMTHVDGYTIKHVRDDIADLDERLGDGYGG